MAGSLIPAGATDMTELSRKMDFQRPTIKATEDLVDVKLVINLPAGFSQEGEVTLFETSSNDDHHKKLDTVSVPSCHSTCWFQLTVGVENLRDSMGFLVEFTHTNGEFVRQLNPVMVLYTYRQQPISSLVDRRSLVSKRQEDPTEEAPVNTLLSTLESRNEPCGKQTVRLDYSQLRWLDDDTVLISPPNVVFDFCYGHCNTPLNVLPIEDVAESFDKRARILEVLNRLSENRLTPPPCCIPLSYVAKEIIYASGDFVTMTTIPSVQACGCRA